MSAGRVLVIIAIGAMAGCDNDVIVDDWGPPLDSVEVRFWRDRAAVVPLVVDLQLP